jgi:ABC-2 type transport system ATP-binding protein
VEIPSNYPELTVRENLEAVRRLRQIRDHKSVWKIIDQLTLTKYADKKAYSLSQGNAQRLGLAKALLIHRPDLLILDEPSNGLDPAGVVEIRKLLLDLAKEGVTIFMSSHILDEVSRLATFGFMIVPFIDGLFMIILKDPDLALMVSSP